MLNHLIFDDASAVKPIAILVPARDLNIHTLEEHYVNPLVVMGINKKDIIAFNLEHNTKNKIGVTAAREYLTKLKPIMDDVGVTTILCCDGAYFKALTKKTKVEQFLSYAVETIWPEQICFYLPNSRQIFYNPDIVSKITLGLQGIKSHLTGGFGLFEGTVLEQVEFAYTAKEQKAALRKLLLFNELTCDIETADLQVDKAGLGTISFAWNEHEGIAFPIDYKTDRQSDENWTCDLHLRHWLKEFFIEYKKKNGKMIYHGGTFDMKILIWELFMYTPEDTAGMLEGLHTLFHNFEDTKSLAYLATNSTAGNSLGLKDLAFEFVGNYGIDTSDITKYPVAEVLEYNLTDACATWYVYKKYRQIVKDIQEDVYVNIFKPSLKTITQMELTGLPLNLGQVLNIETKLTKISRTSLKAMQVSPIIVKFVEFLRELEVEKANARLKKLRKTTDDFLHIEFKPGSNKQLQLLLFQELGLSITNKTVSGNPSTDSKTLNELLEREKKAKKGNMQIISLIENLLAYSEVDILLTTFIPAFKNKSVEKDGWRYLLGNFNLGGTKSGRLSSSDPNLQNIPSTGTSFAKDIKSCFQAPPRLKKDPYGWLYVGADYFSLEDKISALLTKDPNKLAIYIDGYDGHCLRAYSYFKAQMPDITLELESALRGPEKVAVINSIADRYPDLRQDSKSPTFALTYLGTWRTLIKSFGFSKKQAVEIEKEFHKLYFVSDEWIDNQIKLANQQGYVDLAFGLRLRTPMLPNVVLSSYKTMPWEAYKEIKTVANATGQSYGLLNSYSGNMFMEKVWAHPKYQEWILPGAQIHDSQYYLVRNHLGCMKWVNDNLIQCMEWADLEPIWHPTVGLGAQLEVYYPDWSTPIKIPNYASLKTIKETLNVPTINHNT